VSRLLFAFPLIWFSVAGCSTSSSTLTSPSSSDKSSQVVTTDQMAGTWRLVSIQPASQAAQPTPSGASYTLTLTDGRISTKADCNVCGGSFSLSGQTLLIGPLLACTRAACPTMSFESAYTRLLDGEHTVTTSKEALVLASSRGVARFMR
jgi:heat shock protein HslJ